MDKDGPDWSLTDWVFVWAHFRKITPLAKICEQQIVSRLRQAEEELIFGLQQIAGVVEDELGSSHPAKKLIFAIIMAM